MEEKAAISKNKRKQCSNEADPEQCEQYVKDKKRVKKEVNSYKPINNNEQLFEVEKVIKHKMTKGKLLYLVKWAGYSEEENTWEPQENLPEQLLQQYNKQNESKQKTEIQVKQPSKGKINQADDQQYIVEKIIGKKKFNNQFYYKIKWLGYSNKESTWEPTRNLTDVQDMIEQFDKQLPKRKIAKVVKDNKKERSHSNNKLQEKETKKLEQKNPQIKKQRAKSQDKEISKSIESQKSTTYVSDVSNMFNNSKIQKQQQQQKQQPIIQKQINKNKEDNQKQDYQGNLQNDVPEEIEFIDHDERTQFDYCLVHWKQQENKKIQPSVIDKNELKKKYPYLLLDYYEKNVKYIPLQSPSKSSGLMNQNQNNNKLQNEQCNQCTEDNANKEINVSNEQQQE